MKTPTILSFLYQCLDKAGLDVDTYHLSDNSSSGIEIRKENERGRFMIELQFDGAGLFLQDIKVFAVKVEETDQTRVL